MLLFHWYLEMYKKLLVYGIACGRNYLISIYFMVGQQRATINYELNNSSYILHDGVTKRILEFPALGAGI
jgi:hypothetical protein